MNKMGMGSGGGTAGEEYVTSVRDDDKAHEDWHFLVVTEEIED